jgi:spore germination protein YaaH
MKKGCHVKNSAYLIFVYLMLTTSSMVFCSKGYDAGNVIAAPVQFGGWITYWDFQGGLSMVNKDAGFSDVYFFAFVLTPQGRPIIYHPGHPYAIATADLKSRGIRTWLTVVNDVVDQDKGIRILKDPATVQSILHDPDLLKKHIHYLVDLALRYGFEGVDIDYENLLYEDREAFTRFIEQLSNTLQAHSLALSVTVQPKTAHRKTQGAGAIDWGSLCNCVDQIQVMLYNLHSSKTGPGPLASISWINDVMTFAIGRCPKEKIVPVLKTSGIVWNNAGAKDPNYLTIKQLATEHADKIMRTPDGTPYIAYTDDSRQNILYFEDPLSLNYKISALYSLGLDQISLWRISQASFSPRLFSTTPEMLRFKNK